MIDNLILMHVITSITAEIRIKNQLYNKKIFKSYVYLW